MLALTCFTGRFPPDLQGCTAHRDLPARCCAAPTVTVKQRLLDLLKPQLLLPWHPGTRSPHTMLSSPVNQVLVNNIASQCWPSPASLWSGRLLPNSQGCTAHRGHPAGYSAAPIASETDSATAAAAVALDTRSPHAALSSPVNQVLVNNITS
jgi:hypothetical protein